jgi:hypothetical protein
MNMESHISDGFGAEVFIVLPNCTSAEEIEKVINERLQGLEFYIEEIEELLSGWKEGYGPE